VCTPPRDRALLNDFFKELDPVECVIGEAKRGFQILSPLFLHSQVYSFLVFVTISTLYL